MQVNQEHTSQPKATASTASPSATVAQRPAVPALQAMPLQQKEFTEEETLVMQQAAPTLQKKQVPVQLKSDAIAGPFLPVQRKENQTGLPDNLKTGVENLSGTDLSDVKVHYGSPQPAQYKALAYAQGTDIHIAPGQEQHLPHEAWHVAQQKQGRVQATTQMKGAGINDDAGLEKEADDMGAQAMQSPAPVSRDNENPGTPATGNSKTGPSLVSTVQQQTFDNINQEINATLQTISATSNSAVQKQAVKQLVAGKFLVDDGEELKDGQMHKSTFLAALRSQVKTVAAEILEPVGLAQDNCPDLNYWIGYYGAKDAAYFEAAIARYAPDTTDATTSEAYLAKLTERVKTALEKHVSTGANEFDPEEAPAEIMDKRPAVDWLPLQKKADPIQFGCGNTPKDSVADPAQTSGDRKEATGSGTGAPRKIKTPKAPAALFAKIEAIRGLAEPLRCQRYMELITEAGVAFDDGWTALVPKDCGTPGNPNMPHIINNYGRYGTCGGTQILATDFILGERGKDALSELNKKNRLLTSDNVATVFDEIQRPGMVASFSAADTGNGSHCFTIASDKANTDSKEVGPQVVSFYLFQDWAGRPDADLLNTQYTKRMDAAALRTFMEEIVVMGTHRRHFSKAVDTTPGATNLSYNYSVTAQ